MYENSSILIFLSFIKTFAHKGPTNNICSVQIMAWWPIVDKSLSQPMMAFFTYSTYMLTLTLWVNSLAPGKFEWNFRYLIFQIILVIDGWVISCELALRWMPLDLIDDKSTLVLVMAWCRQAPSHYLSQCWPRSLSPNGITRPQWVNPCHPELFLSMIKIYLHFPVFLSAEMAQEIEVLPRGWQGPIYPAYMVLIPECLFAVETRILQENWGRGY